MPRLPKLPDWSSQRNFNASLRLQFAYEDKKLKFNQYSTKLKQLIQKEKNEVRARNAAYEQQLEKKKLKRSIATKLKKVDDNNKRTFKITDINKIGFHSFLKSVVHMEGRIQMRIGDRYYAVTDNTRNDMQRIINREISVEELVNDSWKDFYEAYENITGNVEVGMVPHAHQHNLEGDAFFKYTHNTVFDLRRYGIYKTGEVQDHTDTCLINALRAGGLEQEKLERLKITIKNRIIPFSKLNEICDIAKIKIVIKRDHAKQSKKVYGEKYERTFIIGSLEEHYFLVEPTEITSYCINNYDSVKHLPNFTSLYKEGKHSKDRFIDSFDVIKHLLKNPHLLKLMSMEDRVMASTQFYDSISQDICSLEYDVEKDCRPVEAKLKKENKFNNVVFDFETDPNTVHKPYLVRTYNDKINNVFIGDDCGYQMLRSLKGNTRLIAHNASYDYRFLLNHLWDIKKIARGNKLLGLSARFGTHDKGIKIEIKDTYSLITRPLRDFPDIFKFPALVKEVMPYNLYTQENIKQRYVSIDHVLNGSYERHFEEKGEKKKHVLPYLKDEDKETFLNNIERWSLRRDDNTYDIVEYSSLYCEIDCKLLWDGYKIFRKWLIDCVKIDIDYCLTSASLAHQYFINDGCYKGVYELGGVPQIFIQRSLVGGRTMCANNEKIVKNDIINDFDAVSLYPSAMNRMEGFLLGKPKVLATTDYDIVKNYDGFFIEILVKSVGIHRAFPLMSFRNDDGIRTFTNDMVGKKIIVDKVSLEDLIQFQNVEFDVIRGYYFDEGFNTQIKTSINFLFNERLRLKKEGNPAETIYKLIMNSGYGKSIMKPIESESRIFDNDEAFNVYLSRNYNWITSWCKFGTKTEVKTVKTLVSHFNIAQVGTMILSWSKRIMNEVMTLAEDNDLEIYYQDTDSMHIKDCDIPVLSEKFKEKYGRELIGKNMGQFHSDFDLPGCKDIVATQSIFLGKKSYIDKLQGIDKKTGETKIGYHIRMKGIPNSCLTYASDLMGYKNILNFYEDLFAGKSLVVDLTNEGNKVNFKMNNDYSIETLDIFKRTLRF
jgi:hypothetical protein